jgi:Chaperone of endosialidase
MKNLSITFTAILCTLACVGLLPLAPNAFGVVPPPDGGYPGANTAEGQAALLSLTTGTNNTAVGFLSLRTNTTGAMNTAVGSGTLASNTADQNTATGAGALLSNTTGSRNTANGTLALRSNTNGNSNTAVGTDALAFNIEGDRNTAVGDRALVFNRADENTAIGHLALFINTTGFSNTVTGASALRTNTGGSGNSAFGWKALEDNTTGYSNTAVGAGALINNTTGGNNVALGVNAGAGVTTASNVICIGRSVAGANGDDGCYIGNIFEQHALFGSQVFVNAAHKLGTIGSSKRFKEGIRPAEQASEALFALRPVTFRYKKDIDPGGISQFGLVAEDVEKVNPDLIVRDKEGKPYSVRYDQVNAMLLNEFLKEHRKVQALEEQVKKLTAGLQKVSAQIEMSKVVPSVACNNP